MDNGVRDGRSNWLVAPPTLHRAVPPELHVLHSSMRAANHKTYCTDWDAIVRPLESQANALPVRPLRVYYGNRCFHLKNNNKKAAFVLFTCAIFSGWQLVHFSLKIMPIGKYLFKFHIYICLKLKLGTEKHTYWSELSVSSTMDIGHIRSC